MSFRHLIDFGDLTREQWDELYARCAKIVKDPAAFQEVCKGKVSCNLFYEPSTRTNFSFQTAMLRWGEACLALRTPTPPP